MADSVGEGETSGAGEVAGVGLLAGVMSAAGESAGVVCAQRGATTSVARMRERGRDFTRRVGIADG